MRDDGWLIVASPAHWLVAVDAWSQVPSAVEAVTGRLWRRALVGGALVVRRTRSVIDVGLRVARKWTWVLKRVPFLKRWVTDDKHGEHDNFLSGVVVSLLWNMHGFG